MSFLMMAVKPEGEQQPASRQNGTRNGADEKNESINSELNSN